MEKEKYILIFLFQLFLGNLFKKAVRKSCSIDPQFFHTSCVIPPNTLLPSSFHAPLLPGMQAIRLKWHFKCHILWSLLLTWDLIGSTFLASRGGSVKAACLHQNKCSLQPCRVGSAPCQSNWLDPRSGVTWLGWDAAASKMLLSPELVGAETSPTIPIMESWRAMFSWEPNLFILSTDIEDVFSENKHVIHLGRKLGWKLHETIKTPHRSTCCASVRCMETVSHDPDRSIKVMKAKSERKKSRWTQWRALKYCSIFSLSIVSFFSFTPSPLFAFSPLLHFLLPSPRRLVCRLCARFRPHAFG